MRAGFVIILITLGFIIHTYTDGKYLHWLYSHQKYLKMGGIASLGLFSYWIYNTISPSRKQEFLHISNEYLKHVPLDKTCSFWPVLDLTRKQVYSGGNNSNIQHNQRNEIGNEDEFELLGPALGIGNDGGSRGHTRMMGSGMQPGGKRSLSQTKKKYVAASQNWKCFLCKNILSAYFEIDHKQRLSEGGSNHVDNLQALCPSCHRHKTATEVL